MGDRRRASPRLAGRVVPGRIPAQPQRRARDRDRVLPDRRVHPALLADGDFYGTPAELLNTLTGRAIRAAFDDLIQGIAGVDLTKVRGWPKTPSGLSAMLRRLAPDLRAEGIEIDWARTAGSNTKRTITIPRRAQTTVAPVAPDARPTDHRDARTADDQHRDVEPNDDNRRPRRLRRPRRRSARRLEPRAALRRRRRPPKATGWTSLTMDDRPDKRPEPFRPRGRR